MVAGGIFPQPVSQLRCLRGSLAVPMTKRYPKVLVETSHHGCNSAGSTSKHRSCSFELSETICQVNMQSTTGKVVLVLSIDQPVSRGKEDRKDSLGVWSSPFRVGHCSAHT
jgi:hypothetical protein